jgi:hypothetical protein|tara:strand:- start:1466 stop:1867 length:402 start_codon:yes stop_codon:yes gene_type:complete
MATTRFRGPVLQGKFNEGSVTGYNLNQKNANYSVLIGDSGQSFTSNTGDPVFTLPAVAANEGSVFTFVNTGADGMNQIQVTGAAGEYIIYKGVVAQITLTNTKATSKVGDYVKIGGNAGGTAWTVLDIQGTWA